MEMARPIKQISGNRYGKLIVISISHTKGGRAYWNCKCDCGNSCVKVGYTLRKNGVGSCGCLISERMVKLNKDKVLPAHTTGAKAVYGAYRCNSKRQKIVFKLTLEHFKEITSQNCHYCNAPPKNIFKQKCNYDEYKYSGIDKKEQGLGYIYENCVPCCKTCNWAKGKQSYLTFISYLDNLVKYRKGLV
jgi:hypothetical protein